MQKITTAQNIQVQSIIVYNYYTVGLLMFIV